MTTLSDPHNLSTAITRPGPLQQALRQLDRLGRRARWLLLSRRAVGLVAAAIGVVACAVLLDWVFRFPAWFRAIGLLFGIVAFVSAAIRLLVPAWRFRPSPIDLALRVERSAPALRGRLASGVEFALSDAGRNNVLAERAMVDLADRLAGESLLAWLAPRRSLAELTTSLVMVGVVGVVAAIVPAHAVIGAQRILVPFVGAEWPARTAVESLLSGQAFHAKGQPLLLRARLTKGDTESERLAAEVRITRDDGSVLEDSLVMTRQPDGRYERVLDGDPNAASVEVRFRSADAETEGESVAFVPPPAIVASRITIEPPAYASGVVEARSADLGDGTDERATMRDPALVGSTATLDLTLNAPLGSDAALVSEQMLATDATTASSIEIAIDASKPEHWTLRWHVSGATTLDLKLEDRHGITSTEEISFHLEAIEDKPPTCAVLAPAIDESVLPTALVPVQIEGRDDVGLTNFGLTVTRREEGKGEPQPFGDTVTAASGPLQRRDEPLDLASLSVLPGDVLTLVAAAEDGFAVDGRRHDRVLSQPRTLKIISEVDLGKQIRGQLSAIRRAAIRLDEQQGELLAATQNGRFDPALERGQAQMSERMRVASESLAELAGRVDRNRLADDELKATLDQAKDLLETAGKASARASESMQAKRDAAAKAAASPEEQARLAQETESAQEDVRAELEDLVKLLDRDEDSWAMGRAIDRLREEIGDLAKRTETTGKRTVGQKPEELAPSDRDQLEDIATKQNEVAQSAQELLDELRKRAEAIDRTDKARAEAMREAAKAGEEQRLQRNLEQAGEEAKQNRIEQARASQQQAMDALDQMRRGLDDVRKARAEELRRALESLEQSIERLVRTNEDELIALARLSGPEAAEPIADRARAMAKLAQNTQAVASEARAAGSEANPVARLLDRAADSHGGAVGFLRSTPPNLAEATSAEERGLEFLRQAQAQTKQTREQMEKREAEKKKQEILAAYRKIFEKQMVVRDGTVAARPADPNAKLDRRALIESRRLSIVQGDVRQDLEVVVRDFDDVRKSVAFNQAHDLLGGMASDASARLGKGDLSDFTVGVEQQILDTLTQLIEALNSEEGEDDSQRFQTPENAGSQQEQQGGGGGDKPQPAIPPVAELKLLRGMQSQVLERTKRLDAARQSEPANAASIEGELKAIADLQKRLLEAAVEVVKKIEQPQQPTDAAPSGAEGPTGGDGEPAPDAPKEPGPGSTTEPTHVPETGGDR